MSRKNDEQRKLVEHWNANHPSGTPVIRYKLLSPLREPQETTTRSEAWLMGGHTAVVLVDGVAGGVPLDALELRK